jgi:hypothetical protein
VFGLGVRKLFVCSHHSPNHSRLRRCLRAITGDWITQREISVKAKGKGDLNTFWFKKSHEKGLNERCDDFHHGKMKLQINELELNERSTGENDESTQQVI